MSNLLLRKFKLFLYLVCLSILVIFTFPTQVSAACSISQCSGWQNNCNTSQCSTTNTAYCTGTCPDGSSCTISQSCSTTGNPSCTPECNGRVGNFTYTYGACAAGSSCEGLLGPNGTNTQCKYCVAPVCTPGETDPDSNAVCNPPSGCTASRTCTSNYEWGACSTPVCISPPQVTLTVNKGDVFALDWRIGGSASTCTAYGTPNTWDGSKSI